jgi:hypothetical protein
VSSVYRGICLNHEPPMTFELGPVGDCQDPDEAGAHVLGHSEHQACDVVIGRYSYPLIYVGCPGTIGMKRKGGHSSHRDTFWTDVKFLRLAALAYRHAPNRLLTDPKSLRELEPSCWPMARLARLLPLLDVPDLNAPQPPGEETPAILRCRACLVGSCEECHRGLCTCPHPSLVVADSLPREARP